MPDYHDQAGRHLGQSSHYTDKYNPDLLVKIPRANARIHLGLDKTLPFTGFDVWNAYEVSALTAKGLPVNCLIKIIIPAESDYIVESKSLKLYLNSFNMTPMGQTGKQCLRNIIQTINNDLSALLATPLKVQAHTKDSHDSFNLLKDYPDISQFISLDDLTFPANPTTHQCLSIQQALPTAKTIRFSSNLLRSNCRITNQPDWADICILMHSTQQPSLASIIQYIISHRRINHFHEEVAEMIFMDLYHQYTPEQLMVACLYTRRGGIDINPIRSTHASLIPDEFVSENSLNQKTLRQ